jgi:hypothetical protein
MEENLKLEVLLHMRVVAVRFHSKRKTLVQTKLFFKKKIKQKKKREHKRKIRQDLCDSTIYLRP